LLKSGEDVRQADAAGNSALGYLFNPPFIPGARTMFHESAPENQTSFGTPAQRRLLKALLAAGADANAVHSPVSPPDLKARVSQPDAGMRLVRRSAPGQSAIPILLLATCCGDAYLLTALLRAGADPATALPDGRTALDLAYLYGCGDPVLTVLRGAGTRRTRPDTLAQRARRGDLTGVAEMLGAGVPADTPEPDLAAQRMFMPNGDVRTQAIHGHRFPAPRTMLEFPVMPLMQAVAGGHEAAALALLDAGAEGASKTMREAGLLGWAARQGMSALCRRLIETGWDPNGSTGDPQSPLSLASRRHTETMRTLLRCGASPDGNPANTHDFPLAQAVAGANEDAVALLLGAGASPRGRDHRRTAAVKALRQAQTTPEIKARITALLTGAPALTPAAKGRPAKMPDPAFQSVLGWIEQECGRRPQPWRRRAGVFELFGADQSTLDAVRRGVIARGFFAAFCKIAADGSMISVRLFPSPDPLAAVRACGTHGGEAGPDTEDIVAWLTDLARLHPFDLEACDTDFLFGRFRQPVGEAAMFLAKRMQEFCPTLKSLEGEALRPLARDLEEKGVFYFWWA
jgi:ankyrin repeat protein